ncbi:MAG: hypothetical protein ABSH32_32970 [Bryobacteraceae bacterium]
MRTGTNNRNTGFGIPPNPGKYRTKIALPGTEAAKETSGRSLGGYSQDKANLRVLKFQFRTLPTGFEGELQLLRDPSGRLLAGGPKKVRGGHVECGRDLLDVRDLWHRPLASPVRTGILIPNYDLPQVSVVQTLLGENLRNTLPEQVVECRIFFLDN